MEMYGTVGARRIYDGLVDTSTGRHRIRSHNDYFQRSHFTRKERKYTAANSDLRRW